MKKLILIFLLLPLLDKAMVPTVQSYDATTGISIFDWSLRLFSPNTVTDYYVSTSGNNSNNGLSSGAPWQTLSKVQTVCNAGTVHAGDRILFKCGDTLTGTLLIGSVFGRTAVSGASGSPITFTTYGSGAKPIFLYPTGGGTPAESRTLMTFQGLDYYIIDGIRFSDQIKSTDHVTPANCGVPIYMGSDDSNDADRVYCNHFIIRNVDIEYCGMGIVIIGSYNEVYNCTMNNFKNLKSTPNTGGSTAFEDYGANPFTLIAATNNYIHNNIVSDGWAESYDFGYNGGFCEMFRSCSFNIIERNSISDCNGLSEFGSSSAGYCTHNTFAYNIIANCGLLIYYNIGGTFSVQVDTSSFFGNTVTEIDGISRNSGSNAGAGIVHTEAQGHFTEDARIFGYNTSPSASMAFDLRNNIFQLNTGIDLRDHSGEKTRHENNIYKLSNGSVLNFTAGGTETSTSSTLFVSSSDFHLAPGSPAIGAAQIISGFSLLDYYGNAISGNAGAVGPVPPAGTLKVLWRMPN